MKVIDERTIRPVRSIKYGPFTNWVDNTVNVRCTGDGMKGHDVIMYHVRPITSEEETKEQVCDVRPVQM